MMIVKICAVILISACAAVISRQSDSTVSKLIPAATLAVVSISVVPYAGNKLNELLSGYESYVSSEYIIILFKALGVSFICAITSEICTTCGERLLSEIVTFVGKVEILILCFPFVTAILNIAGEML